ncbi:unnamed protein product [Rotaria magnacalcarata]|uniref:Major facilitator superfamily (MFS) profile domain-containing protein n=1 Tax=Rotaria magnacalcarata TaxID=392030 RepID=A0A8S2MQG6_9BILA|nr:unnamed protein product [Rotaria magnacalcarata]
MVLSKNIASFEVFIVGRILIGFSAGFGATVGPIYVNEIAPLRVRGSLGACFQLFVAFAVLLAQILGLDIILGRQHLWNYLFAIPIIFSVLQCTLLMFTHETPAFLLQKKRRRAATRALKWFRREKSDDDIQEEIHEMEAHVRNMQTNATKISIRVLWSKPLLRKCILILIMTHVAQHFTGGYVIFFFGDVILTRANLKVEYASYAMLSNGIAYLAVAISLIFIVDKIGRRSLLLYGLIGMAATSCVIGVTILKSGNIPLYHMIFLEIFAMMAHVSFSAMGPSSIPWLLSTDMFLQPERVYASAIAIVVNWLSMFFVLMTFVPLFVSKNNFLSTEAFINETNHRRDKTSHTNESTITLIFSLAVSIFALGGMIGGLFGGFITDRFGRKGGMLLNNIVSVLSCVLMFISKPVYSYEALIVGRFFLGLSCGYGSSVAPTYINEVSPRNLRGTLGAAFQLGVVVSLFLSQGISLNSVLGSENTWHYALALPIVFSIMQVVLLLFVPETPKYLLIKRNDLPAAEKALQWLRKHPHVQHEISEMQEEQRQHQHSARMVDLFFTPTVRWALFITVFLQLSQQFSGINAVIYYSTVIFQSAGFTKQVAQYANLGLGGTNVLVTVISVFLMDRLGRRLLHLTGIGGMFITSLLLVISLVVQSTPFWNKISLIMTILFIAFFGIGPGSIPWLITAELFTHAYSVPASSIAVLVNWSANFIVGLGFKPLFTGLLHQYTFVLFTGLLLIFFLLTFFFVPETKAKTVDAIYAEINAGRVWSKRQPQSQYHHNRSSGSDNVGSTVNYENLA